MIDKRKTLDKKEDSSKLQKLRKSQQIRERGITLIALVVTIIILLILAGVTLNIALSDNGLFSKTKKATEDYKEAQSEEEESIRQIATQLYSEYVGAKVEGYSPAEGTGSCTVEKEKTGHDTNQTFSTESISWRVWDYDGNTLRIIGDPTEDTLALKGAAGYNNGVWAIDQICRTLYSNEEKGAIATNLKRTDIQRVSTYDYTKYKHNESGDDIWGEVMTSSDVENLIYFGESKNYNSSNKYPNLWDKNDREWTYEYNNEDKTVIGGDKECKIWETIGTDDGQMTNMMNPGSNSITFKQSYYNHQYNKEEFINEAYYNLIFKKFDGNWTGGYWLAGRYVNLQGSYSEFGIQRVNAHDVMRVVDGYYMCQSDDKTWDKAQGVRPIVSIDLKDGGYEMTSGVDGNGKMTITLKTAD